MKKRGAGVNDASGSVKSTAKSVKSNKYALGRNRSGKTAFHGYDNFKFNSAGSKRAGDTKFHGYPDVHGHNPDYLGGVGITGQNTGGGM